MDSMILAGIVITAIGLIGLIYCILKAFKARKAVEKIILGLLICASSIAILTTVGIVMSVLF